MKINHIYNSKNTVDLTTIDWSLIVGREKVEKVFDDYLKDKKGMNDESRSIHQI